MAPPETAELHPPQAPPVPAPRRAAFALAGLLILAALLRLVPMVARSYVGDADQTDYLSIAQGLLQGHYPTADFGPGFSIVVALVHLVGVPLQWAGQVSSLLLGVLLIGLCFALAGPLYGAGVGLALAFLLAIHPGSVDSSISGMAENALLVGLVGGLLLLLRGGNRASARAAVLPGAAAGLLFGFAYLVRPDGALLAGVLCLAWLLLGRRVSPRPTATRVGALAALAVLLLVIAGNTLAIWRATGEVRPQQRGLGLASIYDTQSTIETEQALFRVWSGEETGDAAAPSLPAHAKRLVHNCCSAWTGSVPEALDPALLGLAGFGLLLLLITPALRWPTLGVGATWLVFPALSVAYAARPRHLYPLVLVVLLWAAYGLFSASRLSLTGGHLQPLAPAAARRRLLVLCSLVLLVQLKPLADLTQAALNGEVPTEEKRAGQWLRDHAAPGAIVLERKSIVGWYAGLPSVVPPATNLPDVLRFAKERQAQYLVVSERRADLRPFLRPLLQPTWQGSPALTRLYETPRTRREPLRIVIYGLREI